MKPTKAQMKLLCELVRRLPTTRQSTISDFNWNVLNACISRGWVERYTAWWSTENAAVRITNKGRSVL